MALIGKTPADVRDKMIKSPGGILRNTPPWERPKYEPSKRLLTWPNGSYATIFTSADPDDTRGFSGDTAWLDEFAAFYHPRLVWDNLNFGMREVSGDRPRIIITSTPRPLSVLNEIEAKESTVTVVSSSYENRANLDPQWYHEVIEPLEGTTLGRQEIWADILADLPGALWQRRELDQHRVDVAPRELHRLVVAVDPATTSGEEADETGIIVAALDGSGHGYVLDDLSCRLSPKGWAQRVVRAYHRWGADQVVAEKNQGGDMVALTIHTVDENVPVKLVHASRGKRTRAEPIAAKYEQGRVHHVGTFGELEDQMCMFTPDIRQSPDRVDAMVWAFSEILIDSKTPSVWVA
jgi:phage terminase large subunit-like protein